MTAPVTAIVPLFNGRRFIREAIASIEAQQPPPREILVVDDGSSDDGAALLDGIVGLRVIRQENRGEAAARNRGIQESQAPFIAFLDQDDLWQPDKLAIQLAALQADPAIDIVHGRHRLFVEDGADWIRPDLLDRPLDARLPGALLVRRTAFERVGSFREDMKLGSDVDWLWRAGEAGLRFQAIEQEVLLRRVHAGNASRDMAGFADGLLAAARASLRRRR